MALKSSSGANGESALCIPPHFEELYEFERHIARKNPPAVIKLGIDGIEGGESQRVNTSTRKKTRTAQIQALKDCANDQKDRFELSISLL